MNSAHSPRIATSITNGKRQVPPNLAVVVFDNGRYGETGMQPSHTTGGADLVGVAKACGFREALGVSDMKSIARLRELLCAGQGPILINAKISSEDTPRAWAGR